VFSLFVRVFEPEINDPGKPLMRRLIVNYGRQMLSFVCRQLLYYGHIYDRTEFLFYMVMVPALTFLSRQLPREYYIKCRYLIAYILFERRLHYGYRLILCLNNIETLHNNELVSALTLL